MVGSMSRILWFLLLNHILEQEFDEAVSEVGSGLLLTA